MLTRKELLGRLVVAMGAAAAGKFVDLEALAAETPVIEVITSPVYSHHMDHLHILLKEHYMPAVVEQLNRDSILLRPL